MAHPATTYNAVSRCWSIQDVTEWLSEEGFVKYAQAFQDNYIDGRKLLELDDSFMKDRMKIPYGDRSKLVKSLDNLKSQLIDDREHGAPETPDDFSDGEDAQMGESNNDDDQEYEVPPDNESDGDACYSEPDDDLQPQKRGHSFVQPPKSSLPQKPAPMVKPPAPVPKPAVNAKPSPTSWLKPKAADADFARPSPGSSPVAPPGRPPKKFLQVSGPGKDFQPEPTAAAASTRQFDKAASDRVSRSDISAGGRPLPPAPISKPPLPKPQLPLKVGKVPANDDDEDDDDADDYLEPGEPDDELPGPIQLPEAVSATRGKKSSLDKVGNLQPTRPDARGRGFVPPAPDKKAPSRTASASTGTSTAGSESRAPFPKPSGTSPFGKPLPPPPPTEVPSAPQQQPKRPSISSTTKVSGGSESYLSKGNGDVDSTQNFADEEEEEEEEEEDEEAETSKSSSGSVRMGFRNGSKKVRNFMHGLGQQLAGIQSKFKEKPKKTPDETEMPGEAEQNSNESFNNSSGGAKPGQRPPALLPAPGVKPPATRPPPLPVKPGSNHTDAASESGSDSGSIPHRGRLPPQPPVPSGRESKVPMLPNPFSRQKTVAEPQSLEKQPWFKSSMDRKEAIAYLQGLNKDGAFVVRNSSKGPDSNEPYSLSAYYKRVYHLLIRRKPNNRYALGTEKPEEITFATVIEMIEHHKKNAINLSSADGQEVASTVLTTV